MNESSHQNHIMFTHSNTLPKNSQKKKKENRNTHTHHTHTHNNFSSSLLHAKQPEEQTVARVRVEEGCKPEALRRHQLHDDVQRRSGGVLERIADGVSRHRRLVRLRSLGSERRRVVAGGENESHDGS